MSASDDQRPEQRPEWKKALKEANAVGWIGFFILVIAIGVGTIYFGTDTAKAPANQASTSQSTQ